MEIGGLPLHILLLHFVVVLCPALGLLGLAYAARPVWQRVLFWPLLLGSIGTTFVTLLTAHFGEELERALPRSEAIHAHAELGDACKAVALVFLLVALLALAACDERLTRPAFLRWGARLRDVAWLGTLARVLLALAGLALVVVTILAGHSGAAAAWADWRNR